MSTFAPGGARDAAPPRRVRQQDWAPYAFLAPVMIFFVVFFALPVAFSLYLTFTRWNGFAPPSWVGIDNFTFLFNNADFLLSLRNTLFFAAGTVFLGIPLALLVAFTFTQSRLRALWRSVYWLPMITNVVAVAYLWAFILDGRYGLFNRFLGLFGVSGPNWLTDPQYAMWAIIIVSIWTGLGANMLIFSAGLEGIDASYTEAAQVDGAGLVQSFWNITLPLLRPTLALVLVFSVAGSLLAFDQFFIMTNGGPANSTITAVYSIYRTSFISFKLGYGAALSVFLMVVLAVVSAVQMLLLRNTDHG